ncbi:MAG TPA: hypothetical protein VFM18_18270 [Methanosarcina sp.]|nr:hypothetical protein [Methanosarcina sp.]
MNSTYDNPRDMHSWAKLRIAELANFYQVHVSDPTNIAEILYWCNESGIQVKHSELIDVSDTSLTIDELFTVWLETEQDVTIFKLRWCK